MFAYGIFKVIYAPREVFKEVVQNPRYLGPILIMVLFVAANLSSAYVLIAKTFIEATEPPLSLEKRDVWTENKTFWQPLNGAQCTENHMDYIEGGCYGNRSIEFWIDQSEKIAMELQGIGRVNCSVQGGYTRLYFRVKWTSPSYPPKNASLYLYSGSTSFYRNISDEFSDTTANVWNNLTIALADKKWLGNAYWENITGLKLEFVWNQTSNIRVLVDGLFFGGVYEPYVESISDYLVLYAVYSFMQFFLRWFLLGGIIYVFTKMLKAKTVWRATLVLTGFALITMFMQAAISTAVFSVMPTLRIEHTLEPIEEEVWLVSQVYNVVQMVMLAWTVALCTIAIRLTAELPWTTSFLTAFVAYFAAIFIESFLIKV